jgi:hypothetical protein
MSKQPEALRLADALERMSLSTQWDKAAAAELRRLHAANKDCVDHFDALMAERNDLLAVLKGFSDYVHAEQSSTDGAVTYSTTAINHWAFLARAAIAKATGAA